MEILWSMRMNATHDGSKTEHNPLMLRANPLMLRANRRKTEPLDWLIGSETAKREFGAWTAVDYSWPEIRDLAFGVTEEVCTRYR
jgi:hypothetical protein